MPNKKTLRQLFERLEERIHGLRNHTKDSFGELKTRMRSRFGKSPDDELFRALPRATHLTADLDTALSLRKSERSFSDEPVTDFDLSALLWAADGVNRTNGRKTTPSALNWQEVEVYVLKANGIWRWVPERRGLLFLALDDVRAASVDKQPLVGGAPVQIVYVADFAKTRGTMVNLGERVLGMMDEGWTSERMESLRLQSATLSAGAKAQSVYLACASLGMACVLRLGYDEERLTEALRLGPDEKVLAVQSVGYRPTSLLDHWR